MTVKFLHFAIAGTAIATIAKTIIPVQAAPGKFIPFCHQRTDYGQVINLNELCRKNPDVSSQSAAIPGSKTPTKDESTKPVVVENQAREKIEFSDLNYDKGVLVGSARNKTRATISNGAIRYEVKASADKVNWKTIDAGVACFMSVDLPPKETTTFRASTRNGDKIIILDVGTSNRCN